MTPSSENGGKSSPDLSVTFAGIQLKNPIIAASGTFGYGVEFEDVVHLDKLGGFVVKGLSREPMIGNPPPRLWETAAGMLNAIGLQNIGAAAFLEREAAQAAPAQKHRGLRQRLRLHPRGLRTHHRNPQRRRRHRRLRTECLLPQHHFRRTAVRQRPALPRRSGDHGKTRRPHGP